MHWYVGEPTMIVLPETATEIPKFACETASLAASFCTSVQVEPLRVKMYAPPVNEFPVMPLAPPMAVSPDTETDQR